MPFLQMKKIKSMVKFFGIFLALLIIAGCVAQNSEKAHTSEQSQIGTSEQATGTTAADVVRQISTVAVNLQDQNIDILIHGNKKLVYTSIKQSFPFGIAVYLPETVIAPDFKTIVPDNKSISDLIVAYADKEKTTVKVEILLNQDFDYEVIESDNSLKVTLSGNMDKNLELSKSAPLPAKEATIQKIIAQEEVIIPDKTAIMTNIEFATLEDGKSDIVIQTNQPVKYDITRENNNKIYLNLYNTIIPDYHKRPIITEYFKSAVQRLMPVQIPGNKKNARIEINMREQVPYRIVRGDNNILMFFEPSTIEPPEFTKAKKKVVSGTILQDTETAANDVKQSENVQAVTSKKKTLEEEILGPKKKFTGEKIKLDFYETDIKNVFRILRSVGGLNFAIDKNVEGKVTLALENPLPWDQVLDLVLTIKKEDKLLEETINARKKSIEQKHIEQILSKDRGKISVDKRSNMIIITDTQAKIDQAKEIIFRLDQVTPQIMIEAKVVEVTKNFTRELGLGLSLSQSRERLTSTGRDRDFTIALNSPVAAPANTGAFNFWRIFGSNYLSLGAQIAASEVKGDVKVVSSPRILTLDNKLAKIKQGLEYAYLERDDTGGSSVKFKNIDLLLEVTPHVTPDKRIAMVIHLTKNDLSSVTNGVPSLSTNEANTELLVNNNDTIVIGGVIKTTDNTSKTGTPFLSGIPVLGRLFRTDTDTNNRNELLIFITPSIIQLDQKRNNFTSDKQ